MVLQLEVAQHTFQENESGPTYHMKIDYDDSPVGDYADTEVHLVRVRSSEGEEFTFKVRVTESAIATERQG